MRSGRSGAPITQGHFERTLRRIGGVVTGTLVDGELSFAGMGAFSEDREPEDLCFEIGSITKVFSGILLAEMSLRDEVSLDDPIGEYLPPDVRKRLPARERQPTLSDLSAHTSGLPRIPRAWLFRLRGNDDPYAQLTEAQVFAELGPKSARPSKRRSRYSNFGAGLLGHLLARAGGRRYEDLVVERILRPLDMAATGFVTCGGREIVPGFRRGKPTPPWTFGALAGAGALRSNAADMLIFARATISPSDGELGDALRLARRPVHTGRFGGVGLGWHLRPEVAERRARTKDTTWHNGGTYGSSSFLAVDVERAIAIIALGNGGPGMRPPLDSPSWDLFDALSQ